MKIKNVVLFNPFAPGEAFETVSDYSKSGRDKNVPLTTALAIRDFLRVGMSPDKINLTDSSTALRILEAIRQVKDQVLQLDKGDYEWIKKQLEDNGNKVFGINFRLVVDAISDLVPES